jgi:serine protease AprX
MRVIITFSLLALSSLTFAQTATQREVIKAATNSGKELRGEVAARNEARNNRVKAYLQLHPEVQQSFTKDNKPCFLYDVSADGNPVFISTKDINQISATKVNSILPGGSIGVNFTGANMVAGVWDGGQLNTNHELLIGQSAMEPNQTLSSQSGNEHQQAVTGIMVGKNIKNARGIAYGATSKNYDWDNDVLEMSDFADSGYLISNHSYGYLNDTNTPVWQFGAYDIQSQAWDALLKAKPFYLPFVAVGNEQTSSGNPSANGFDIITGSSASKNVVTVGAVDLDRSMSDYSNWGPTDDGRIKPDIVTLGTEIDVPLYDSDTTYTGFDENSSGTSYASPAVAASALLLQQYYYSLNNAYMKAAMLKALLLHTADDDSSNNGPDAKFGWGLLNVEKAANLIKQNSLVGGTAKMVLITTNPANDATAEVTNNFECGPDAVRASLCWIDDEGAEQTSADPVNDPTSKMVYDFSMKLEQVAPALASYPYNNLSIASPGTPAAAGTGWFQTGNNYLQANLSGTTNDANGKVSIRKSAASPSATREMALIISGLKAEPASVNTVNNSDIIFFDKADNKIKLVASTTNVMKEYQIYAIDGQLLKSGKAINNEIAFNHDVKNIYTLVYKIKGATKTYKFAN